MSDVLCNKCGKHFITGYKVDCKYLSSRIEDTERLLCPDCYKNFKKYIKQYYEDFFTYYKENKQ